MVHVWALYLFGLGLCQGLPAWSSFPHQGNFINGPGGYRNYQQEEGYRYGQPIHGSNIGIIGSNNLAGLLPGSGYFDPDRNISIVFQYMTPSAGSADVTLHFKVGTNGEATDLHLNTTVPSSGRLLFLRSVLTSVAELIGGKANPNSGLPQNIPAAQQQLIQHKPQQLPQQVPQPIPNLLLHNRVQQLPQQLPQQAAHQLSQNRPQLLPQQIPQQLLQNRIQQQSQQSLQNPSQQLPQKSVQQSPQQPPQQAPQQPSQQSAQQPSQGYNYQIPKS